MSPLCFARNSAILSFESSKLSSLAVLISFQTSQFWTSTTCISVNSIPAPQCLAPVFAFPYLVSSTWKVNFSPYITHWFFFSHLSWRIWLMFHIFSRAFFCPASSPSKTEINSLSSWCSRWHFFNYTGMYGDFT